ncbi:MAG TPA: CcmD family protein [Chryseosolibacter sp.]|nr:CcmD family protein [Chryseosolibacter sp.]
MKTMIKYISLVLLMVAAFGPTAWAQNAEMADAFRADGKIYVVVAVILIVLVGLFVYLFMLDRKLSKLERMIDAKTQTKRERKSF